MSRFIVLFEGVRRLASLKATGRLLSSSASSFSRRSSSC